MFINLIYILFNFLFTCKPITKITKFNYFIWKPISNKHLYKKLI